MPLHVDIITPERQILSKDVDFISAPAEDGEIGILPHHAPLLIKLGQGEMRLKLGNETQYIVVYGGFLEVQEGSLVSIFAETAETTDEIDIERARLAAERAKSILAEPKDLTPEELAKVESALARAVMRLKVGQTRKSPPRPPQSQIN